MDSVTDRTNRSKQAAELHRQVEEVARKEAAPSFPAGRPLEAPEGVDFQGSSPVGRRFEVPEGVDFQGSSPVGRRFEVPEGVDFQGSSETLAAISLEEAQRMLHELRLHQVELETQNGELRRVGADLDAAREQYFAFYDLSPVGYCTLDEDGLIREANLTAATLLGLARGALVKQPITRFILPVDRDIYCRHRKHLLETGEPQASELRMVKKGGVPFWARLEGVIAQDPEGAPVFRFVMSDITERKAAEVVAREASRYARNLLETSLDSLVTISAEGRITDVNAATERITGVGREGLIGRDFADYFTDPPRARAGYEKAFAMGQVVDYPLAVRHASGTVTDVVYNASVYRDEQGEVLGVFAAARDITEQRRSEEALKRTAEVLSQSNEEVRQFAYIVSHDLRAPLVNVGGFATELRDSLADLDDLVRPAIRELGENERASTDRILRQEIPEALGFIDASVMRMDHMISSLLRLSHAGRQDLVPERLDLRSLVSEIVASLGTQIEARGAIVWVLSLPEVVADRTSLEQILSNILTNAVLYLDPARPGRIEIAGKLERTELQIKVSDNGRGIAPDDREAVFAPFRRAGAPDVPGEGMGLAYVHALVRRQGGRIWFDSEPGVGTTFSFTLPVVRP